MKYAVCLMLACVLGCGRIEKVGSQGAPGATGSDGARGPAGAPGSDAASARVVPLCPGTSNYGTFVEVALCLDDQLYAIYSQNGGFMTLLAPGNYTSNAIGSACNLTVQAHCVVGAQ